MSSAAAPSLSRGAAAITIATAVSRVTGFLRVVAAAAAMGTTFLANTYQSANTAPNLVFELLAAGVLTSVFVPTFVEHLVRGREREGWEAANALTSVALVGLIGISVLVALFAPAIMRLFLIGVDDPEIRRASLDMGTTFLRLFAPQVIFYGAGMIMTAALHAHRRFTMPAIAPIFNNVVVIGVYLSYASMRRSSDARIGEVTDAEVMLLGLGTTAGVVAMTLCLLPALKSLGWRFRFDFRPSHPAVKRGARLGIWALSYAGGYQAGLIVVLVLANRIEGGVAAYQWAYTFFYLPHALFGVPIFHVLFTAMAEHVSRREEGGVRQRLTDGLGMLFFILIPISAALLVLSGPLTRLTLEYGVMTPEGSTLVARTLGAFALGLPAFSLFLVSTRAFYALSDTRTPALVNLATVALSSLAGFILFTIAAEDWTIAGLALGHSVGAIVGSVVLLRALRSRLGTLITDSVKRSSLSALVASVPAAAAMWTIVTVIDPVGKASSLAAVAGAGTVGALIYWLLMRATGSSELRTISRTVRSLIGRGP